MSFRGTTDDFMKLQIWNSDCKDVGEVLKKFGLGEDRDEGFYFVDWVCG